MWAALAPVGASAGGGYDRFAWTPADRELRSWFRREAGRRGLDAGQDRNGNLWAWWGRPGPGSPGAVVTGSHLDSVPGGGAFDGPLGVVSGFLAIDCLREKGVRPARPVAVAAFADEEGARFGVACAGSRLLTGALAPDVAASLRDADGVSMAAAMAGCGVDPAGLGPGEETLARIGCFVELHIEQGRGLADLGAPLAVASGIWPHGRWRLTFRGEPNHAGTTPLAGRHDPMLPFAVTVLAARRAAGRAGGHATVGRVSVQPGGVNTVPGLVEAWLDARAPSSRALGALVTEVTGAARHAAGEHGVELRVSQESRSPGVTFSQALTGRVAAALGGAPALATAAGHDAGILAARVPAAMIFVRNPTGASHCPAERAAEQDCLAGVRGLAAVLEELAAR